MNLLFLRALLVTSLYQAVVFFGNWIVFSTVVNIFGIHGYLNLEFLAFTFLALWAGFVFSWLLVMRRSSPRRTAIFWSLAIWMGTGWVLIMASVVYWLVKIVSLLFGFMWPVADIGKFLLLLALFVSAWGVWNSYRVKVKTYKVSLADLPKNWHGKKIVMLADVHLGNIRGLNFSKKIAALANRQQPDIVLIPGDFFDGTPAAYQHLAQPFSAVKSRYGVFFANGNHEEFSHHPAYFQALAKAGIKVLHNEFVEIEGLQIAGVTYHATQGKKRLAKVLAKIPYDRAKPTILMKHVPTGMKAAESDGVGLMLSGHTHRAQLFPFNFLTGIIFHGYDYGLKPFGKMQVITTSGAGTWGPPQRIGTNSEIVVIILQ